MFSAIAARRATKLHPHTLLYIGVKGEKRVNIFRKRIYCITALLSAHCKTYCFAFQKRRFCTVKAAVLHRKTYAFATPNRNYCFSSELSLQNQGGFLPWLNQNFIKIIYFTKYFRTFVLVSRSDNCLLFFVLQKGKVGTVFARY
ncbi:hypothetical protein CBG55_09145 [Prevotella intermedia]|uniref:Uncharacterized protein n=1 Tax=Prevotella intermedia TaxID=28131 RepID=A0A2M8TJ99_PREIN|nr:hypothetical protein CBG55_09145 [Prevotella intermedia]PJI24016.1 hypothetical protein CTM59_07590 [Prevotella intermedia]